MSQSFLLEPDIIAATENAVPEISNDMVLAKNFLKQQSAASGDNLYDHLVDVVHKILSQRPPDVVDRFEQYSWEMKQEKFRPNFDLLTDVYLAPPQLTLMRKLDDMFKLIASKSQKLEAIGEEEEELDLEEEAARPRAAPEENLVVKPVGFGLPDSECYALYVALNMLAVTEPVATVRFFGKIYGTKANYYVAETDLTIEELDRRIREFDMKDMPGNYRWERARPRSCQRSLWPPKLPPPPVSTWSAPLPYRPRGLARAPTRRCTGCATNLVTSGYVCRT
ncbi:hypothetical protein ACJJTC_001117 [Scirpophaga incertulas]